MTIHMYQLPYALNAMEPFISEETMNFHYNKHYATYIKNTNDLIFSTDLEMMDLPTIVKKSYKRPNLQKLFNNAGQSFNHEFFWRSLTDKPEEKQIPTELLEKINIDFGLISDFYKQFTETAVAQFGSGWCWLVKDNLHNKLKIVSTSNADTPLTDFALTPLLCVDVWEHAYYLDYQNRRADFVKGLIENSLNWRFAENNLMHS